MRTIVLRFRDLVTDEGGTVEEHRRLIERHGSAWWGWWKRQYEVSPRPLFRDLAIALGHQGSVPLFLFDTGASLLYRATLLEIRVSPSPESGIRSPDAIRSPSYYHQGRYPAWFLLQSIERCDFREAELVYDGFPSRPDTAGYDPLIGTRIAALDHLRNIDVTLWQVQTKSQ